jgi:hypothetical protein
MFIRLAFLILLYILPYCVKSDTQISTKVAFRGSRHLKPTTKCNNINDDFPLPPNTLPDLVQKARLFAQTYFTEAELTDLRERLERARNDGADRLKIRQVVENFVNEVLDEERKLKIQSKRSELDREFSSDFV